jgi:hypothetical protein
MGEHLITSPGALLDCRGYLREPGYAFRPAFPYDRRTIAAPPWRIKEWDYYLANDKDYAVALTLSDLGYMGLASASVMDFSAGTYKTTTELIPIPLGSLHMPASSEVGDVSWHDRRCSVEFAHVGEELGPGGGRVGRRLSFSMADFDRDEDGNQLDLEVELLLDQEPRDSMVIATPWDDDPLAFYYNRKVIGMQARGGFRVGGLFHEFAGAGPLAAGQSPSFGLLDWGRGVWTYDNVWYWAAAMGIRDGLVVGLNLGYGFGDTSAASENMVFVDGIAHKLGRVDFGIPTRPDGTYDYMAHWHMTDDRGRLDLDFSPDIDRRDLTDVAHLIVSDQHQVYGLLNGSIVLDDGATLHVSDLRGSAEHIHNKY